MLGSADSDDTAVPSPDSPSLSRYDLVLLAVPAVLVAAVLAGAALSVSLRHAVGVGATLAALLVGDSLFRNPPTGPASR